jgi:hypothetical protein
MADAVSILTPLKIPDSVKADALDAYHGAHSTDDLIPALRKLPLSDSVRADLLDAKHAEVPPPAAAGTDTADPRTWSLEHNPVSNFLAGAGAGAISTGVGAYNLARKIPGVDKVLPAPNAYVQGLTQAPQGVFGGFGKFGEQAAEFMLPMSKVAKAAESAPIFARLAAESLAAGTIAGVQTGGDPTAMAETAATTGALGGIGAAIPAGVKSALTRAISNGVRPLSQGAKDLAAKYGVSLTTGMETGSRTIQAAEKLAGQTVAPDLYEPIIESGQQGLAAGASDLSSNFATDKFTAGQNTVKSMLDTAKDHADTAATEYANLAKIEADPANTRMAQVGTKPNASLDPTAPDRIPDMQPIGLPVDMRPTKAALAPLEEEITRRMTPAQRRADPGLSAIQNILSRPDALPASVAEADLSYLKSISRSEASGQAKRIAGIAIDALDKQVKDAVSQAGPDALDSLNNARGSWAARSSILDDVKSLTNDATGSTGQTMAINKLIQPSDANFPMLEKVLLTAPNAGQDIGKAYLTEHVFKSAAQGENFTGAIQAANKWNHIGPRTKAALYSPEQIQNVNDFLELAKRVSENPNPSGTGTMNGLMKMGVMFMHPVASIPTLVFGRNIAKVLYNPAAAENLRTAITKLGSPEASKAMLAVKAIMQSGETAAAGNGSPELTSPGTAGMGSPAAALPTQ